MKKIIFLLLFPIALIAQKSKEVLVKEFMNAQHDFFRFNGNILVAKAGNIIYQQPLGFADFNTKKPLNDSSIFELASLSKQFTAMGIMMLKEKKLLDYQDKIVKFFPIFLTRQSLSASCSPTLPVFHPMKISSRKNGTAKKLPLIKTSLTCFASKKIRCYSNLEAGGSTATPAMRY